MIVFEILLLTQMKISKQTATHLLAGIYTDTGGFKHSNTNEVTYLLAGKLIEL